MLIGRPYEVETHRGFSTCVSILNNDLKRVIIKAMK